MSDESRRHSVASEAYLIKDENQRAGAEARNGLLQYDYACRAILDAIEKGSGWKLRPSLLLGLHREALQGISAYAGNFRPASVVIQGSAISRWMLTKFRNSSKISATTSMTTGNPKRPFTCRPMHSGG